MQYSAQAWGAKPFGNNNSASRANQTIFYKNVESDGALHQPQDLLCCGTPDVERVAAVLRSA